MIRPSKTLLLIMVLAWLLLGFSELYGNPGRVEAGLLGFLLLVMLVDALAALRTPGIQFTRKVPGIVPLGETCLVGLDFQLMNRSRLWVRVFDHHPEAWGCEGMPQVTCLQINKILSLEYTLLPLKRGVFNFEYCQLEIRSPWHLWYRNLELGEPQSIKVYPNYANAMRFGTLAAAHRLKQMGIHTTRQRGDGSEFHQLREFRVGDPLNRISWKATARTRKIITKELQTEKNQQVLFVLDLGRNLHSSDGDIPHFEHVVNALILQAYVALKQGDSVGIMTFAGEERWLSPQNKPTTLNTLLELLFDLETTHRPADYMAVASKLRRLIKKRTLIILLTNSTTEENQDLQSALKLLGHQHLVLLTCLKEKIIGEMKDELELRPNWHLQKAITEFETERKQALQSIRQHGVKLIECHPGELPIHLVNAFLDIKASHIL